MEWMTTVNAPGSVYLMQGNEAVVRGALEAGIDFAASYPGSPSSQVLSMLGNATDRFNFYAEWSTNEVVAFEACLGASFAGARALCIVKQNGLLVLGDALCCGALSGIRGGLVLITSDDPDSHSSTNEFDSRHMADMADVPMLEPTCMQEAKDLLPYAFELSEQLKQIVMIRLTTRVCHGRGNVVLGKLPEGEKRKFRVDEWDRMLCMNLLHGQMLDKLDKVQGVFESCEFNHYEGPENPEALVIAGGTGRMYTLEALEDLGLKDRVGLLSLATIWPLPEKLITSYLKKISRILVVEEVDPVLQRGIYAIAGKNGLAVDILGRDGGKLLPRTQELNPDVVRKALMQFMNIEADTGELQTREDKGLEIPDRELSFCAGCPHRATFFLLKQAVRRQKSQVAVVGDIGCYTMAGQKAGQYAYQFMNCMGSGIAAASGLGQLTAYGFDQPVVAMAGDSTFFHTCIPGLINARYHSANILYIILDNSATAMTGFQPHPGTGLTAMGRPAEPISIQKIVEAIGCSVTVADPFKTEETLQILTDLIPKPGVKVLIMRQPCATLASKTRARRHVWVDEALCKGDDCGCGRFCARVWGCPGNSWNFEKGKARIDEVQCVGCGVCADLCPNGAIKIQDLADRLKGGC